MNEAPVRNHALHDASPGKAGPPGSRHREIVFTICLLIALALAWFLRSEIELIYVSALFAVVLNPLVRGIMRLRIGRWSPRRGAAIFILFLLIAAGAVLFVALAVPPVIQDLRQFVQESPTRGPDWVEKAHRLPILRDFNLQVFNRRLTDLASSLAGWAFSSITGWARGAFDLITGIILTVYFMLEGERTYHWLLSFFPVARRDKLDATLMRAAARMGRWLVGQGALMLILGVLSTIVFVALHIRYAYALGVLMGLFNIIPVVGAMISVALAVLVAGFDSWGRVAGVLIFYAIYVQVENSYLTPRIMKSSVGLAGLAVIIALLFGWALAGVVGALVSVPTAVLVAVLLDEYGVRR